MMHFPLIITLTLAILFPRPIFSESKANSNEFSRHSRLKKELAYTEIGKSKVFFYYNPEKVELSKKLRDKINNNEFAIGTDVTTPPCPVCEIALLINEKSTFFENQGDSCLNLDASADFFDYYSLKSINIANNLLSSNMKGLSRHINLIVNHDAVKYHKDYFTEQYNYLSRLNPPIDNYYLIQDLTLIDWSMAKTSFSGTILQDRESEDRLLMILFPGEVFSALYTEPIVSQGKMITPSYPGPVAFPFHTALSPMDYLGDCNMGSWKGKRISTSIRGVVLEKDILAATNKAKYLPISRPQIFNDQRDYLTRQYPNGITVKSLHTAIPPEINKGILHPPKENITILEAKGHEINELAEHFKETFQFKGNLLKMIRLIKYDQGFNKLLDLLPALPPKGTIIILNHSQLQKGYKNYQLAENCLENDLPWIQLYSLPRAAVMSIPISMSENILLTPVEEIFLRDEITERLNTKASTLSKRLITKLDVFIFEEEANHE